MSSDLTRSFDHQDPDQMRDPYALYAELRSECPVGRSDHHGGFWVVSRHYDVEDVVRDPATYCSGQGIAVPLVMGGRVEPQESDGARHAAVRALMVPWFSTTEVAGMEPLVRSISTELLDACSGRERVDLATDYAMPLASLVMLRLMGFPTEVHDRLQDAIEGTLHARHDPERQMASVTDLAMCVAEVIADRRAGRTASDPLAGPRGDLLARMLAARIDDVPVTDEEAVSFGLSLVFAGLETSAHTIAMAALVLADRPDLRKRLRDEPGLLVPAVEELLRLLSPVQAIGRRVTTDTDLAGRSVAEGDTVVVLYGSANHDPEVFTDPEELDIERPANRHLAFGAGVHRCLGRHLARLELRVALADLVDRVREYDVPDPDAVVWGFGENRGVRSLPVRVTDWG